MLPVTIPIQPIDRPPSLHLSIQDAVKAYIINNQLSVGDPLPSEIALSKQLGVSRNLVREAIRGLEAVGIVEIRHGSGLYVGKFSFERLIDNLQFALRFHMREFTELYAIRRVLETGMIEAAIAVKTEAQVHELRAILGAMRGRAMNGEPFPEEDRRFHQCLFERLNNHTLLQILDSFWLTLSKTTQVMDIKDRDPMWTYKLHVPIVESFERGDVEATREALGQHHIGLESRLKRLEATSE